MTLDEMYIETAMYTDEIITKTGGVYTGESLSIINKFKSAINYAYNKICREKYKLDVPIVDLTNLTDTPLLPNDKVDHKILCFFAAFQYFNIDDDDRAGKWLNLWNDGFESIKQPKVIIPTVDIYDIGGGSIDSSID